MREIPVLIVGGGPVGLALALDLGWRGVPCLLVEQTDGEVIDAKMFATGIRTVEFCRRWGIAEKVKHWGFPEDFPFDNVFVTSLNGHELGRIADAAAARSAAFPTSPERFAHCPQFVFDPILADAVRAFPSVNLRYHCRLTVFADTGDGVTATLVDEATGTQETVRAHYLIGCDGFGSTVRKALGIEMHGIAMINRSINVMFSAPALWEAHDKGKAGRYVIIGPEGAWASLTPADGRELWRLMIHGEPDTDPEAIDAARRGAARHRARHRFPNPQSRSLGAPPDGRGSLRTRPRVSRRRCGARDAAERWARHEHRHRRCG